MKSPWFKRLGWFYVPISWQGSILAVLAVMFCVQIFVAVERHSHSASDTVYGGFPYWACCFLLLNWIGSNTGGEHP